MINEIIDYLNKVIAGFMAMITVKLASQVDEGMNNDEQIEAYYIVYDAYLNYLEDNKNCIYNKNE